MDSLPRKVVGAFRHSARRVGKAIAVGLLVVFVTTCRSPLVGSEDPPASSGPPINLMPVRIPAADTPAPTRMAVEGTVGMTPTSPGSALQLPDPGSFDEFLEQAYTEQLRRDPELVTELGIAEALGMGNGGLTDLSDAFQLETYELYETQLATLRRFDRAALPPDRQLTYDLFARQLEDAVAGRPYRFYNHPVKQVLGVHLQLLEMMTDRHPMRTRRDAEDYVARLEQFPVKIDQLLLWLEAQHAEGIVMPAFAIGNVIWQMDQFVQPPAERTELYTVFTAKLEQIDDVTDAERSVLRDRAYVAIDEQAQPAYRKLQEHFRTLQAEAPVEGGMYTMPDGAAAYAYALRYHTTTDLTADEIHGLGLQEVSRIQAELDSALDALGVKDGDLADRIGQIAVQGGSVPADQVLDAYAKLIDDAEQRLAPLFAAEPQARVVMASFETGGAAYYVSPSVDGTRPGTFYVGVGGASWRFAMPTLAYHEAVPGHHFQLALAQERTELPLFRRTTVYNAYAEGWALYAEQLAWEAGWYAQDPYGNVGRLQSELFRAARLVVDTGIHAKGWTREESVAYMIEQVGQPPAQVRNEVERYILWPGQATAYKVGMLEILNLRTRTESALGDDFDIRSFHGQLLMEGSLPLSILDERMMAWVDRQG